MNRTLPPSAPGRRTALGWLALGSIAASLLSPSTARTQVVINEVLASNRSVNEDDDGDTPDWVELYNAGPTPLNLAGYGLSDRGNEPSKWVFRSQELDPGEFILVWCSGKNRTAPTEENITRRNSPFPLTPSLIGEDEEWRYLTGAPDDPGPPADWHAPGFDDGEWSSGRPPFGFGEEDIDFGTELEREIGAVFLRHTFFIGSPEEVPNLVLEAVLDDGLVVYINGERAGDLHYPFDDDPSFASTSRVSAEAGAPVRIDLTSRLDLLRPGENVLGLALLNFRPTSTDMVLVPRLGHVPPVLHASFRLDRGGELVMLTGPEGQFVDGVRLPPQASDRSYGRFPDGTGEFGYMLLPTPSEPNDARVSSEIIPTELRFEPESGRISRPVDVTVTLDIPFEGFAVRYTLDGTEPNSADDLYEGPIAVGRDRVIRAAGFLDGRRITPVVSKTYFGLSGLSRALELPVMSIIMDPADFQTVHLGNPPSRGRISEKPAHLEIFDEDGALAASTGFGLRLHGGAGRNGGMTIKKAYRAYFRGAYGDTKLRYPVIPDTDVAEFDKLVLRSNFNDAFRTGGQAALIRDQVIRDLHEDMGGVVSHGAWYNLLANGRYLGVYNVVERMDKDFFASYFPADGENWDVIKTGSDVLDGSSAEWSRLLSLARRNLRDDSLYNEVLGLLDVETFTSYMILNIWAQNHDWPHNNWYAARPRRADGKWLFLSWDAEFGIGRIPGGYSSDTFNHVFSRPGAPATVVLAGLLQNADYQQFFLDELERHLSGALSAENVKRHISRLAGIIRPDIDEETRLNGGNAGTWLSNIRAMEIFAERRNPAIKNFILNSSRFSFPRAIVFSPRSIVPEGEMEVSLRGLRFTSATQVFFEDIRSPEVVFESSSRLLVTVPFDIRLEGKPDVTTFDPNFGGSTSEGLIEIRFLRPRPAQILPPSGSETGGDTVLILGEDFTEGARVEFGGVPAPSVFRLGKDALQVVTPPGTGTVEVRVTNTRPGDLPAEALLTFTYEPAAAPSFRRADVDADGRLDVSDALRIFRFIQGKERALCEDALDVDDSGGINLTDGIFVLDYLFRSLERTPAPPFAACGADPTEDGLSCEDGNGCG